MRVFEVMTNGARTVAPTMAAADALGLMRSHRVHHLVVTSDSRVVGVLSDRDVDPRAAAPGSPFRVGDLMTTDVVTVDREETVRRAANLLRGRTIGCLPVTDSDHLVGIVTTSDLLQLLGKGIDRPARSVRHTMNHKVPHRKVRGARRAW